MPKIKDIIKANQSVDKFDLILLLAFVLKQPKEFIYTHDEYNLSWLQNLKIKYYTHLLKKHYPLSYITKNKEFFNLNFFVNKHVLIPRPDTEIMVEEVLKLIDKTQKTLLVDIGTGSGCIPISILKNSSSKITAVASDISSSALQVAQKNTKQHKVKIQFVTSNLLDNKLFKIINKHFTNKTQLIITANLPYLNKTQYKTEPSIQAEPKKALIAKKQGMQLYYKLIKRLARINKPFNMFLEIDPTQVNLIKTFLNKNLPKAKVKIKKDLAGLDRIVNICLQY